MPHAVAHRNTKRGGLRSGFSREEAFELVLESTFILASAMFVVGSFYVFPQDDEHVARVYNHFGCRLYEYGSFLFMCLSTYTFGEGLYLRSTGARKVRRKEIAEQFLYFLGSFIFLIGTLIWDQDSDGLWWVNKFGGPIIVWNKVGIALFGFGSFLFALAAFFNAMNLKWKHPFFTNTAHTIAFCYEFGGLCFVMGTLGFIPDIFSAQTLLICNPGDTPLVPEDRAARCYYDREEEVARYMKTIGCWCYLIGSILYLLGSVLSLLKTIGLQRISRYQHSAALRIQGLWRNNVARPREHAARAIQSAWTRYRGSPETIPNQGSRALVIQQTCRGSFSAVSKPIFAN